MNQPGPSFGRLYEIFQKLRGPDGCPWDKEQTPRSIRKNLIEEAYECIEAINDGNPGHISEEIGDVYLVITMMAYMYEQEGIFSVADALEGVSNKLVRRHPHVFGETSIASSDEVLAQWQDIKTKVEGRKAKDSLMDEVSHGQHPMERSLEMQKKAAKVGFDWPGASEVWAKAQEELEEARQASTEGTLDDLESEIGDLFFSVINLARYHKVDPGLALQRTVTKFDRRFRYVETGMKERGLAMDKSRLEIMESLWQEAKSLK